MCAYDPGSTRSILFKLPANLQERQVLLMPGDSRRRQKRSRSMPKMSAAHGTKRIGSGIHEIGAGAAVDMEIHISGHQVAIAKIDLLQPSTCGLSIRSSDVGDSVAGRRNAPSWKQALRQDHCTAREFEVLHGVHLRTFIMFSWVIFVGRFSKPARADGRFGKPAYKAYAT